ncbi:MAG: hypothetical protein Q9183_000653 [Haloplaca sp. 2 TL-2023]
MLLWMLCLNIWWLWLPLRTLAYPAVWSTLTEGSPFKNVQLQPSALLPSLSNADGLLTLGPKLDSLLPLLVYEDGRRVPPSENATDKMMLNEFWLKYNGSGVENMTQSALTEPVDFDWYYPPGLKKHLIEISGFIDPVTTDTEINVHVLGYPLGDYIGNLLDGGMRIDVNLFVAKGDLILFLVQGRPKDQVWIQIDLSLPFHQRINKKIHMFDLPHRDYAATQAPQEPQEPQEPQASPPEVPTA